MATNQACFPLTQDQDGLVLNQITKVRTADGREIGIVDWSWRPLFSTVDTLSGWVDQELRSFVYSQGDEITTSANMTVRSVASLLHTNVSSPAEMDALEEYLVYAICCELYYGHEDTENSVIAFDQAGQPLPIPNQIGILHHSVIGELEVSQKAYQQASLGWFAPGFGVTGFGADANAPRIYGQNSVQSREALDMFPVPTHIGGTEKFSFILHNPEGTAITYRTAAGAADPDGVLRVRTNLMGLHKRPSS